MARRFSRRKALRRMWDQPTIRTIKVPKLQTIVLIVLLVVSMTLIVWVSFVVQGESPQPAASEPPTTQEGPAAWLSAWSTFWSAIAGGLAALGTAGALLIAAFGYKHQVEEKERQAADRRQQARDKREAEEKAAKEKKLAEEKAAKEKKLAEEKASRSRALQVSLLTKEPERILSNVLLEVHNGSPSPIKNVMLICLDRTGAVMGQTFSQVLAAGHSLPLERPRKVVDRVWARFQDVDGKTWKVHVNGYLEEV